MKHPFPRGPHYVDVATTGDASEEALDRLERDGVARLKEAWAEGRYEDYIFGHGQWHLWRALTHVVGKVPSGKLAELFRRVWLESEHSRKQSRQINRVLSALDAKARLRLYGPADWKTFRRLPDPVTIYRGAHKWNTKGRSWTLSADRAALFAQNTFDAVGRAAMNPEAWGVVYERTISKGDILFYTDDRQEEEIVTVRPVSGTPSARGAMLLAIYRGPKHAAAEFERQQKLNQNLKEFEPHVSFWRALAKEA